MGRLVWRLYAVALVQVGILVAYRQLFPSPVMQPSAVLVFGGDIERDVFAVDFVKQRKELLLFISSPQQDVTERVSAVSGRTTVSWEALDTVTNLTTMIPILRAHNIRSVYIVSSEYHMLRAKACAKVILYWYGIDYTPLPVPASYPHPQPSESILRVARDVLRSVLWCLTGVDGSSITARVHPDRRRVRDEMMKIV